jgi:hypothetical protein
MSKPNSIESRPEGKGGLFRINLAGADVFGLFSNNVGPFSRNLVPSGALFSINVVPKRVCFWARRFMFSGRYK